MVRIRAKGKFLVPVFLYAFIFVVFLIPIYQNQSEDLFHILFLDFDVLAKYGFSRFNIEFLVINFLLFFYFVNTQISDLLENTSFLSMVCHKQKKNKLITIILKETLLDNVSYMLISLITILGLCFIIDVLYIKQISLTLTSALNLTAFLVKYFMYLWIEVVCLKLSALIHVINHEEILPYVILVASLLTDHYLETSFFSITVHYSTMLFYLGIIFVIGCIVIGKLIYQIYYAKELFI